MHCVVDRTARVRGGRAGRAWVLVWGESSRTPPEDAIQRRVEECAEALLDDDELSLGRLEVGNDLRTGGSSQRRSLAALVQVLAGVLHVDSCAVRPCVMSGLHGRQCSEGQRCRLLKASQVWCNRAQR